MFFPYKDYKTITFFHGFSGPAQVTRYTTTTPCVVYFEPSTNGGDYNTDDGGCSVLVRNYVPANGSLNPAQDLVIFEVPLFESKGVIVQAGKDIVSYVPNITNDGFGGTLHILELP